MFISSKKQEQLENKSKISKKNAQVKNEKRQTFEEFLLPNFEFDFRIYLFTVLPFNEILHFKSRFYIKSRTGNTVKILSHGGD